MAADCMTRVWALAIATAACVIFPGALVYEIVLIAAARRLGVTIALSVFLVIWAAASAAYYPRVCADIVRWSPLVRYLRGRRAPALLPRFVAQSRQGDHGGMLGALPREPPAATRARQRDGEPPTFERCAVCLCDVEKVETAKWLPACQHMFHRNCINQWLHQHGHSTCPICRCDAFAVPLPRERTA